MEYNLKNNSVKKYLEYRNSKYDSQSDIIKSYNNKFIIPYYFPIWLSGFIEVQANFYSVIGNTNTNISVNISHDYYIINAIKNQINIKDFVCKNLKTELYKIYIYKSLELKKIINHLDKYPLLGENLF